MAGITYHIQINVARRNEKPVWCPMFEADGKVCSFQTAQEALDVLLVENRIDDMHRIVRLDKHDLTVIEVDANGYLTGEEDNGQDT